MSAAFPRLLVANRGEIAVRVIRAAQDLGIATIAVFSETDAGSPHVALADEAVCIGPAAADRSYLSIDRVIDAARRTGATMVHPGYGFLSENAAFARACGEAGLIFVGPSPDAIVTMGSKRLAKAAAAEAGLPCLPGHEGDTRDAAALAAAAERIGYPLMVKATLGGGGRGLRLVGGADELASAVARARSEAASAFGSDEILLEKALPGARHIEVQILADAHGAVLHLFERDCSIQRRHQKVIEEAPSPVIDAALRERLGALAVTLARHVGYVGAGTVEFLVDRSGAPFFLEMNPRLQVEHPVTEAITGIDIVQWQLRIALGGALPFAQHDMRITGHAIEARLYAEDADRGFAPQTGTIQAWRPAGRAGVRYDMGIAEGVAITPAYDAMLGKVIAHGPDRATALRRLHAALRGTVLLGVASNRSFALGLLQHAPFAAGNYDLTTLQQFLDDAPEAQPGDARMAAIAAALLQRLGTRADQRPPLAPPPIACSLEERGRAFALMLRQTDAGYAVATGGEQIDISLDRVTGDEAAVTIDGIRTTAAFARDARGIALQVEGRALYFIDRSHAHAARQRIASDGRLSAAMEGVIVAVLAAPGDAVAPGQPIIVMESMKMEHQISAGRAAIIETIGVAAGDKVFPGQPLASVRDDHS